MIKDDKESLIWEQTVNSIFFRMTLYFVSFLKRIGVYVKLLNLF